jgi:hypothetical protein
LLTAGPAFWYVVLAGFTSCLGVSVLELFSNHTSQVAHVNRYLSGTAGAGRGDDQASYSIGHAYLSVNAAAFIAT